MGMVLSSRNIGETDRRIVILTREKGKISAFARGAVKPKNPLVSATQPFTFGEFFVYPGRDSYTVTGADISKHFELVQTGIEKYYYASYLCELADYYTRENLDASDVLLLLYQSLRALEKGTIGDELVRYIYEWRMLMINGEAPNVFECLCCHNKDKQLGYFSVTSHGLVCNDCSGNIPGLISVSASTVYTLQYIMSTPLKKLFTFNVKPEILAQIKFVTDEYIKKCRNYTFNSLGFIENDFSALL